MGIALMYSKRSHGEHRPPFGEPFERLDKSKEPPPPGMSEEFRATLHREVEPLMAGQHSISKVLLETLTADVLDTIRLQSLTDSLGIMRCRIQQAMISQMVTLHGTLSPEERKKVYTHMIGKIAGGKHHRKMRHHEPE